MTQTLNFLGVGAYQQAQLVKSLGVGTKFMGSKPAKIGLYTSYAPNKRKSSETPDASSLARKHFTRTSRKQHDQSILQNLLKKKKTEIMSKRKERRGNKKGTRLSTKANKFHSILYHCIAVDLLEGIKIALHIIYNTPLRIMFTREGLRLGFLSCEMKTTCYSKTTISSWKPDPSATNHQYWKNSSLTIQIPSQC